MKLNFRVIDKAARTQSNGTLHNIIIIDNTITPKHTRHTYTTVGTVL